MKGKGWLLIPVPLVLGLVTSLLLGRILAEDVPQLYLKADLIAISWLLGLVLSCVLLIAFLTRNYALRHTQNQVETAFTQSAEERRRFLRRLDHELKNPLTAIQVALANLAYAADGQSSALDSVKTQTQRISQLVADLRKLAELETRELEVSQVNLTELLEEVIAAAEDRPEASERSMVLTIPRAPWPLPEIQGDWDLIFLAIYNLVSNALKFTHPGDTIEVRAFEDSRMVVIEVADTGPGIPEDEQALVWEELYRAKATRGIPGSGLGLALVRAIVQRHNGQIILRSREAQGTVVSMRLPLELQG
jgi:two-component system OmpR family sensor kinase